MELTEGKQQSGFRKVAGFKLLYELLNRPVNWKCDSDRRVTWLAKKCQPCVRAGAGFSKPWLGSEKWLITQL